MRLKSEIWIHAYIRTCANANCPAYVVRHGDDDAGAPFIKINHLDGTASLYGPAPAGFSEVADDQRFVALFAAGNTSEADVDAYIKRQSDFDPDLWLIEVEDAKKRHFLEGWLSAAERE
jgi:hypothetical protein